MTNLPSADGDVMHCGYLERARMGTMYNRRWFELYDEPSLYYYEDESKAKVRGMVRLREATLLISGDKLQLVASDSVGKASTLKLKAISADDAHLWGVKIKEAIENAPPEMDPATAKFMADHGGDMAPKFTNQVVSSGKHDISGQSSPGGGRNSRRGSAALAASALEMAKTKSAVRYSSCSEGEEEVIQSISDDEEASGAMPGGLADQIKKGKKLNKVDQSTDDSANWEVLVQGSLLREIMGGSRSLKKVDTVQEKGRSEAMARGGLLNEIQKGNHQLKKVDSVSSADDLMRTNTMTMARAGLLNEINKIRVKEQAKKADEAAPDDAVKSALMAQIAAGNTKLKVVSAEDKKESAGGEDLGRAGLLNEIKKGINPNKVRELEESEKGSSDARVHMLVRGQLLNQIIGAKNQQLKRTITRQNTAGEEMIARGGLLNQIQKQGQEAGEKKAMAEAKEEHKNASSNFHAELLQGINLKSVGVTEGENDGGVKSHAILQAGLMNEIAKGAELKKVGNVAEDLGSTETMTRGGLMNEIAKGKELKQVPMSKLADPSKNAQLTMARAGLLNEINKKRVDDDAEEEKVARALHEANQGNLISAIHEGLTLRNVTAAADGGVNVELVLRGGLMFEINNLDATKLKHVEAGTANPTSEALAQAGLLNEIKKGKELKQVPMTQLPKQKSEMFARGGLMNEIAKQKEMKDAAAAAATPPPDLSGLHSQIAAGGVVLKKVASSADGGVSEEMKLRGGMLNQITRGVELREVDAGAPDGGPTQEVLARGGLMNEIAKGKDLKFVHDGQKAHREGPATEGGE